MDLGWGSPIGMGAFFAGLGVLFWGFYGGWAQIMRAKREQAGDPPRSQS